MENSVSTTQTTSKKRFPVKPAVAAGVLGGGILAGAATALFISDDETLAPADGQALSSTPADDSLMASEGTVASAASEDAASATAAEGSSSNSGSGHSSAAANASRNVAHSASSSSPSSASSSPSASSPSSAASSSSSDSAGHSEDASGESSSSVDPRGSHSEGYPGDGFGISDDSTDAECSPGSSVSSESVEETGGNAAEVNPHIFYVEDESAIDFTNTVPHVINLSYGTVGDEEVIGFDIDTDGRVDFLMAYNTSADCVSFHEMQSEVYAVPDSSDTDDMAADTGRYDYDEDYSSHDDFLTEIY